VERAVNLSPLPIQKFFDNAGRPLNGGLLFTYVAGTTTKLATYQDQAGTPNTNPIVLNFRGEANVWLDQTLTYKFVLAPANDTDPPTNPIWSVDNVSAPISIATLTQQFLGQIIYPRTAEEIAALVVPLFYIWPPGDVRRYGALFSGANDTVAFQTASKLLAPYAPSGTTVITASIQLIANQEWRLDGTVISITGNTKVFVAGDGINDWSILGSFQVIGDNDASGSLVGTGAALQVTGANRWHAYNISAKNIKGHGIHVIPGTAVGALGDQGRTYGCSAYACYIGYETDPGTGAEYCTNYGFDATNCNTGTKIAAGNTTFIGGNIVDNTLGVWLVNGTNHGHGIYSGTNINHNVTQLHADTVTNSHSFVGCHVFQGILHFNHSTGVMFKSCVVDVDAYQFEESDGCGFIDCTMTDSYTNTIQNDFNGTHSFTVWNNCRTQKGEPWRGAIGNVKGVRVTNSLAASQVFSAANVNATSVIKLDLAQNASANQTTQTSLSYQGYVAATGIYTIVKGGDGKVRVSVQLVVSNNAADTGKFQCIVTHSSLGDFYMLSEVISTTSVIFRYEGELASDLAQTLKLQITGVGVLNNVTVTNSGGTKAYVEGL
jgi:hypothetical protein